MDSSRRQFLKSTGLTLTVAMGASLVPVFLWADDKEDSATSSENCQDIPYFTWITLNETGEVVITLGKTELGQGIDTSLGLLIADEMDADWHQVILKMGLGQDSFFDMYANEHTVSSGSIRHLWKGLRTAGAAMKAMLIEIAAKQWNIDKRYCEGQLHSIVNAKKDDINYGKVLGYGELVRFTPINKSPCFEDIKLKDVTEYRYIGKSIPRRDIKKKLEGNGLFGFDIFVDGMLYAQVLRPPRFGAKLKSFNKSVAIKLPNECLAVCADTLYEVSEIIKEVNAVWDEGIEPDLNNKSLHHQAMDAFKNDNGWETWLKWGSINTTDINQANTYTTPYLHHATIETPNCLAHVQTNFCEIWAPTQIQTRNIKSAVKITGLDKSQIKLNTTYVGGGFGRKSYGDFVDEAVYISNHLRRPIKLFWTREDDIQHGIYLSSSVAKVNAGLDKIKQKISHWQHLIVSDPILCLPSKAGKPAYLKDSGITLTKGKIIRMARALLANGRV